MQNHVKVSIDNYINSDNKIDVYILANKIFNNDIFISYFSINNRIIRLADLDEVFSQKDIKSIYIVLICKIKMFWIYMIYMYI